MGKLIKRRSIVLLLNLDEKTADEITDSIVAFVKVNYKIKDHQIEINKRNIFVNKYVEVDEK